MSVQRIKASRSKFTRFQSTSWIMKSMYSGKCDRSSKATEPVLCSGAVFNVLCWICGWDTQVWSFAYVCLYIFFHYFAKKDLECFWFLKLSAPESKCGLSTWRILSHNNQKRKKQESFYHRLAQLFTLRKLVWYFEVENYQCKTS